MSPASDAGRSSWGPERLIPVSADATDMGVGPSPVAEEPVDEESDDSRTARALRALVPQAVANRALACSISTDREAYAVGDPVRISVRIRNRLPLPVSVTLDRPRRWGWSVDGLLEASDERLHEPRRPTPFRFRGRERRQFTVTWDGRFKRAGERTRWELAEPGSHEIAAFVPTAGVETRDVTAITIRR